LVIAPEAPGLPALGWWAEMSQLGAIGGVQLEVCGGRQASRAAIATKLQAWWDLVIWSGHGRPGQLLCVDGAVGAEWVACMMRQAPPGVAVLAACMSGQRDDSQGEAGLQSLAETLSQNGITTVGMWMNVEDRAATVYTVEFARALAAGAGVALAHRVAVQQMALDWPAMAGVAFLLPGLMNGYGKIQGRLDEIGRRLELVESKLDRLLTDRVTKAA
jgi:hypothetical protein